MTDTLREHLKRAGQARTEKKRAAILKNLEKARAARQQTTRAEVDRLRKIASPEESNR